MKNITILYLGLFSCFENGEICKGGGRKDGGWTEEDKDATREVGNECMSKTQV